ncbi:unnamed protein product [Durusdinium trenchii]|uniref:Uncharacterized protein n=1 Tax=Durusdinium trenchii TaxID=1381693 RepID=A0ABP0MQA9_9DINO
MGCRPGFPRGSVAFPVNAVFFWGGGGSAAVLGEESTGGLAKEDARNGGYGKRASPTLFSRRADEVVTRGSGPDENRPSTDSSDSDSRRRELGELEVAGGRQSLKSVSVGVGALAGSTVMLLTLPWFLAILAGRVSLKEGKPTYQRPQGADPTTWDKLDPPGNLSLFHTGIGYGQEIVQNAWTMLYTMLGYVIIQGSAFVVDKMPKPPDLSDHEQRHMLKHEARYENDFALAGLFVCIGFFMWYLWKMWKESQGGGAVSDFIAESTIQAISLRAP